jgi:putative intracellular protease/amidase
MRGTIVSADEHIEDVSDSLFDAVVVVGGTGAKDELWGNPVVHHVLQRALAEHRLVVGLGHGVMALAHAGLLTGKHATCYPSEEAIAELARHGAIRVPGDIVDEGAGGIGAALVGAAFLGAGAFAG